MVDRPGWLPEPRGMKEAASDAEILELMRTDDALSRDNSMAGITHREAPARALDMALGGEK